jgi:hypothetical protein
MMLSYPSPSYGYVLRQENKQLLKMPIFEQ